MDRIVFTKMQGCGNDYIYIDGANVRIPQEQKPALVRDLSDRHFGIGGDGVIFINPAPDGMPDVDFEMEMYNADGSRSEMCGNGIRCVGAWVWEHRRTDRKELTIVSTGARKYLTLDAGEKDGRRFTDSVTVDMGAPILAPEKIPVLPAPDARVPQNVRWTPAPGRSAQGGDTSGMPVLLLPGMNPTDHDGPVLPDPCPVSCVSMGNPHAVVVLDEAVDLSAFPIEKTGPHFENHPAFPNRTNTEFVHVDNRSEVHMRVWERGTGETLACGTGCCATTVACILLGLTDDTVTVHVRGGDIRCRYDRAADKVFMTGPAVTVFEGEVTV